LSHLPELTILDLSGCTIDDLAATALWPQLHHIPRLEELLLSDNRITSVGVKQLCNQAASGGIPRLKSLSLDLNPSDNDAAVVIAAALRKWRRLRRLWLKQVYEERGTHWQYYHPDDPLEELQSSLQGSIALSEALPHLNDMLSTNIAFAVASLQGYGAGDDFTGNIPASGCYRIVRVLAGVHLRPDWPLEIVHRFARFRQWLAHLQADRDSGSESDSDTRGSSSSSEADVLDLHLEGSLLCIFSAWLASFAWQRRAPLVAAWAAARGL
jgi:hypothetical protein